MNRHFLISSLVFVSLALSCGCSPAASRDDKVEIRPDKVNTGPARVLALLGDVQIQNSRGDAFSARLGMWLRADDHIGVSNGGLALLWLRNSNYIVRIEDEVKMRIDEIFLLQAPRTEWSLRLQFANLMTPAERTIIDYIVNWRVIIRGSGSMDHKLKWPVSQSRASMKDNLSPCPEHGSKRKEADQNKLAEVFSVTWMKMSEGRFVPQDAPAPKLLIEISKDQELMKILRRQMDSIGQKHIGSLEIRFFLRSGRVVRIWLQGALLPNTRLRELAVGKIVPCQDDGWLALNMILW